MICNNHGDQGEPWNTVQDGSYIHYSLKCGCTLEEQINALFSVGDIIIHDDILYRVFEINSYMILIGNVNGKKYINKKELSYVGKDTISGLGAPVSVVFKINDIVEHVALGCQGRVVRIETDKRLRCETLDGENTAYVWSASSVKIVGEYKPNPSKYFGNSEPKRYRSSDDYFDKKYSSRNWEHGKNYNYYDNYEKKPIVPKDSISTADLINKEIKQLEKNVNSNQEVETKDGDSSTEDKDTTETVTPIRKRRSEW